MIEWLYLGCNANLCVSWRTQAQKCDLSLVFFLRRMPVDRKMLFLRSTGILCFFVGLHTFYCAELGDLEIVKPKSPRRRRLRCPPPLLPAAPSHPPPNIVPVSAISPPHRCHSPLSAGASKNCQPQLTSTTHHAGRRCCWGRRWWGKAIPRPCEVHSAWYARASGRDFWVDGRAQGSPRDGRTQPASHCGMVKHVYSILQSHQWDWSSMGDVDNSSSHISYQVPQVSHGWLGVSLRSLRRGRGCSDTSADLGKQPHGRA